MFILPMSQVKIFDLAYQLYAFEVFHMFGANRWSHFIGIPISLAATYILLSPIPHGPEVAFALIVGIQLILSVRARLYGLILPVLLAHSAIWLLAFHGLNRYLVFGGAWWTHPAFHVLFWPTLQYLTHATEPYLPPPWSGSSEWISLKQLLLTASPARILTVIAFGPLHSVVELISSHRNFYLMILLVAEKLGYRPSSLVELRGWIDQECAKRWPVIEYDDFQQARSAWQSTGPAQPPSRDPQWLRPSSSQEQSPTGA
jgi:hypothetical protein